MSRAVLRRPDPDDPLRNPVGAHLGRTTWIIAAAGASGRTVLGHVPNANYEEASATAAAFWLLPPGVALELTDWRTSSSEDRFAASGVAVLPAARSLSA